MSLWTHIQHELVDIIEFPDGPAATLVYRFPRFEDQIKYGAKLIVREGQAAVFVSEGKLADVFAPGTYTLETRNLPVLATLQGWQYGFTSPFKSEVYFLSTKPVLNLQWGTQQGITLQLPGFGLGQVRAFGQVAYRIADAQVFFRQIVGTTSLMVDNDLRDYLRGIIVSQFAEALTESKPTLEQLQANLSGMTDTLRARINVALQPLGFELVQFFVESLSLPPAMQAEIFEYSRLHNVDTSQLAQLRAAKAITDVAQRSGGGAGGGASLGGQIMQLGVGLAAAQQVTRALDGSFNGLLPGSNGAQPGAQPGLQPSVQPPPMNVSAAPALYHVALDGKAQGPFSSDQIAALVATNKIDPATLVWHPGMAAWAAAGTQSALSGMFPQQPPPLP